ncbi:MAG: hypothetical protein IJD74_03430 [Clostridia bacterium]|nr:hypothetical protein [Clostridia bacterium]
MGDNKDFDESKLDTTEIKLTSDNKLLSWLSNFWYHNKWTVIIVSFFAIIFIIGIVQMIQKEEDDTYIVLAAPTTFYGEDLSGINAALESLMPSDINKDGKKSVCLMTYSIYSEEEMKAANEEETNEDGRYITKVSPSHNTQEHQSYVEYLRNGEASILFISEYLYSSLRDNDTLRSMSELFGENLPEGTLSDGYGVRLGDLAIYEFCPDLQRLPEDTVVCLKRAHIWGASSNEKTYAALEEFYKSIVTFGEN